MKLSIKKQPFSFSLGERGEVIAWDYLLQKGFQILEKNYRCVIGEIDVIASKNGRLHIIEIKTRTHHRYGSPEESVGSVKQKKLVQLAKWYLKSKGLSEKTVSFDVLAITLSRSSDPRVRFIENAFTLDGLWYEK